MKKKRKINFFIKIILAIIFFISLLLPIVYAQSEEETLNEQQEIFGIQEFLKESKEYAGTFFEDIDMQEILQEAISGKVNNETFIQKVLSILGIEVKQSLGAFASILAIIIIHSVLKSISESLENDSVAKLIYYVQYIAIVTVIMSNFSSIITMLRDTVINLVGFMNSLVPILIALMVYTGSITTGGVLEPIILFLINFIGNIMQNILIPLVLVIASLNIISKISDKIQIDKISKFLKSSVVWFLGIVLTIFVGVVSLEGTLSSSVDGITAKTTKAIVSSAIPVVGKILGDTVDSVLGCGIILKNAVGMIGVLIVVGICILPIIKLGTLTICYNILAGIIEPIADNKIVGVIEQIGDIFKLLLGILCAISVMIIIGTTLVIRISNSGMMYR